MTMMIDCATRLNETLVSNLSNKGVTHVGRYLGHSSWKGITAGEVAIIKGAGIQIVSIFENGSPTNCGYFTEEQGVADADAAYNFAQEIGQPEGTAIYFTVDFDAQVSNLTAIINYFKALKKELTSYKVGVYGNFTVIKNLHGQGVGDYFWQTYAWSNGQTNKFAHIFQYQNDKAFAGLQVDFDNLQQSEVGSWGNVKQAVVTQGSPLMVVKVLQNTDVRIDPDHSSVYLGDALKGQLYNVWKHTGDWHYIILDPKTNTCGWVDGNNGTNLYWVDNPALKQAPVENYIVKSGDSLSKIASANGTTVEQLKSWNNITNVDMIQIGQSLRVK